MRICEKLKMIYADLPSCEHIGGSAVKQVAVSLLSHHPINRSIYTLSSIDSLMHSIEEMGLLQPLVIDQNYHVISGNRRFKAIQDLEGNRYL